MQISFYLRREGFLPTTDSADDKKRLVLDDSCFWTVPIVAAFKTPVLTCYIYNGH